MKRIAPVVLFSFSLACQPGAPAEERTFDLENLPASGSAVVDGRPAEAAEIFATVALVSGNGSPFCTGTLVAPQVVVTAAHCLEGQNSNEVNVAVGVLDAWNAPNSATYSSSALMYHGNYGNGGYGFDNDGVGNSFDIGMVLLDNPVQGVPVAPIMPAAQFDANVPSGTSVVISGFGVTNLQTQSSGYLYIAQTPYSHRSDTEFLAGNPQTPDTCNGDSGGPVYAIVGNDAYLIGATSRAASSAQALCGDGGIYSLVPAFEDWIIDNSQGLYTGSGAANGGGDLGDGTGNGGTNTGGGGSCDGFCGGQSDEGCWCDDTCAQYGDCCSDNASTCQGDTGGNTGGNTGGWTCPEEWIGDNECDCGCGIQDSDCSAGTVEECLYDHCENEPLNESDPSQCGADVVTPGDGDGDGDPEPDPVGDGDGDGDTGTDPGTETDWSCAPAWFGDGECDCGCGVQDMDCGTNTIEACAYDGCLDEGYVPDPLQPTSCIPQEDEDPGQTPGDDEETDPGSEDDVIRDPGEDDEPGEDEPGEDPVPGNETPANDDNEDDRPDLNTSGPGSGTQFDVDDRRPASSSEGGCSATGSAQTPMAALALGLLFAARRRRRR